MSFDESLKSHIGSDPVISPLIDQRIFQALVVNEKTERANYFPAVIFELENEKRDVKTDRVTADYWICEVGDSLEICQAIEHRVYFLFKDFTGKLNDEFSCTMEFKELKRKYNKDFHYWIVMCRYSVAYKLS